MRLLFWVISVFFTYSLVSQNVVTIYCFPGQGSDRRIFDSLKVESGYEIKVVEYDTPLLGMTMYSYAKQLAQQIDTAKAFILLGVSLGGMICVELSEILQPQKTIIISSAKNRNELPPRYKFQKLIPLYKIFPGRILLAGAKLLQPIVEPDRNKHKEVFKSMLKNKKPLYVKRSIGLIINWNRRTNSKTIYHIHGTKDHTLPLRRIKSPSCVIQKGSHMMTLTRAGEINGLLRLVLNEK